MISPKFRRNILNLLRQPIEDGQVTIARSAMTLNYPARFMLVAAMNPCPCGYASAPIRTRNCGTHHVHRYRGRICGSIRARINPHIEVPAVRYEDLRTTQPAEALHNAGRWIKPCIDQCSSLQCSSFTTPATSYFRNIRNLPIGI